MLELRNVSFAVDGKQIIDHVSLTIKDHTCTVITGPNGGGKSTLAKLIMGIEKPTSGQILLEGEDISELSIDERAKRKIGYAFQQPPRFKGMCESCYHWRMVKSWMRRNAVAILPMSAFVPRII